jgi:hypothetical protein
MSLLMLGATILAQGGDTAAPPVDSGSAWELAAEGTQRLDALGYDGHFPDPVEFVEHDHH